MNLRVKKVFSGKLLIHGLLHIVNTAFSLFRWLSVRVEYLGNLLIFLVAVLTFAYKSSLSAGLAGLAITYSMMILDALRQKILLSHENPESGTCDLENRVKVTQIPT